MKKLHKKLNQMISPSKPFIESEEEFPDAPFPETFNESLKRMDEESNTDWETLAKNLQIALMEEMKENERLEKDAAEWRDVSLMLTGILKYLEVKNEELEEELDGNDSI